MTINDLEDVKIEGLCGSGYTPEFKFVVVKITDKGGSSKLIIRGVVGLRFHVEILARFVRNELAGEYRTNDAGVANLVGELEFAVLGGGMMEANASHGPISVWGRNIDPMTMRVWGASRAFGMEPDRTETIRMLQTKLTKLTVVGK